MLEYLKNKRGSAIILLAVMLMTLFGIMALVIDIGRMALAKSRLQNAVDAGALAGAHEYYDTSDAEAVAKIYVQKNFDAIEKDDIIAKTTRDTNEYKELTVKASCDVELTLGKILTEDDFKTVTVTAVAIKAPAVYVGEGIRPFGVKEEDYDEAMANDEGEKEITLILRYSAGNGESGDYGFLDFSDKHNEEGFTKVDGVKANSGTRFIGKMIEAGSKVGFSVEEFVEIANGLKNSKNNIRDLVDSMAGEDIIVPIVRKEDEKDKEVEILGFAVVNFVKIGEHEETDEKGKKTGKGHIKIKGTFKKNIELPGMSNTEAEYMGVRTVTLIE